MHFALAIQPQVSTNLGCMMTTEMVEDADASVQTMFRP
jgi:hypothetical protein